MRGAVAWTRGPVDGSTAPFFLLFLLDKSRNLSKFVLVLLSASVERESLSLVCGIKKNKNIKTALSWFRLAMITLTPSMEIGFQVTFSLSEVQMTSNFYPWSKIGQLWI